MRNWSIQRKTMAGFLAALVVLLAVVLATFVNTQSFLRSAAGMPQSFEAIAAQERIYSDLIDLMWNQRTYIVGSDPADLVARTKARDRLVLQSERLPSFSFAATSDQQARVATLQALLSQELALLDEALRTRGGQDATPQRLLEMRATGLLLLGRIRTTLDEIAVVERSRVETHIGSTRAAATQLYAIIVLAGMMCLAAFAWLLWRIVKDLQARDAIDKDMAQTNGFLESLLENLPSMIFVKDAKDLRFVRFNQAGEQLLGYPRSDLIGRSDRDFFPPEQAEFFVDKDREVLKHGKISDIPEEEIDTRHGRRILHTRKVPIMDADNRPSMLLGISMDITEQKLAEREVFKLNEQLQQKADLLTAANQELESFCYSVSHDLRAPLRAIDGYSTLLGQQTEAGLDVNAKRYLTSIRSNCHHMSELIDDLLEFSRIGRQTLEIANVDMSKLASQAAEELAGAIASSAISIQSLMPARGDSRALYHVWLNLLDNAIKYSANSESPAVMVWAEDRNGELVYSVRDNGVGFDMKYYDKIFGVFERLHSSKEYPGTGVGLAIVQRVIEKHGGRIWADSAPGKGATFHFALPCVSATTVSP